MSITSYDVVIIGAGISGAITAYQIAKYNVKAAVIEAGTEFFHVRSENY